MKRNFAIARQMALFLIAFYFPVAMAVGDTNQALSPAPAAPDRLPREVQTLQPLDATPDVFPAPATAGLPGYRPNQVIVKFKTEASEALIRALTLADTRISKRKHFKILSRRRGQDYYLLTSKTETAEALRERLLRNPMVAEVSFNYAKTIDSTVPNDPSFSHQWALHNTGQVFKTGDPPGTPDADIDAPEAWDLQTGSGDVVIAVLDNGIDYHHPDLVNNLWTNGVEETGLPGIDDDGNGYVDDINGIDTGQADTDPLDLLGHGTHVAGIIAAESENGIGVAGIDVT